MKKLIIFDLDGTLAESKSPLDAEMSALLSALLDIVKVAVISGGNWPQFKKQLLSSLPHDARLKNLSLLPTCGTKFYQYAGDWRKIYSEDFTEDEKKKIISSLKQAAELSDFKSYETWGEQIEDRGSQITSRLRRDETDGHPVSGWHGCECARDHFHRALPVLRGRGMEMEMSAQRRERRGGIGRHSCTDFGRTRQMSVLMKIPVHPLAERGRSTLMEEPQTK